MNTLLECCAALLLGLACGVVAASEPADLFDLSMEELLKQPLPLTGSRLQSHSGRSGGPLAMYSRADIVASGAHSLGEFLQMLPVNGAVLNHLGSSGTAHGTYSVNLRNLGENRSLVLLNGRRLANGTATRGFRDFVDLNTIPLALIERVEVLGAGASAIYGADAIAGVVNLISRGDFDGGQLHASGGQSTRGDGGQLRGELIGGRRGSRWSAWGGASLQQQSPILVDDRDFSAIPLGALSRSTPQGRYRIPGQGELTLRDGAAGDSRGDFRPFQPGRDGYNAFAGTYLRYPNRQQALFGELQVQAGEVRWFAEALYLRRTSEQNFSPANTALSGTEGFSMPADHPFNPFGVDLEGAEFETDRSLAALGPRRNRQQVDSQRLVIGAWGNWWRGWSWEVAASGARNDGRFLAFNQLHRDRLALSIGAPERCAALPGCVPVPLFGDAGRFTATMIDWLRVDGVDRNTVEQFVAQANTKGDLLDLPAGPLRLATGLEYRHEHGIDRPDRVISATAEHISGAPTSGQVRDGSEGSYRVAELFVEAEVPLWHGAEGGQLQANAALRHSNYDSFGATSTGRLGLWFAPHPAWTLRATAAQGFRAPSILELFEGGRITNLPGVDPCVGGPPLPGCAGVPDSYRQSGAQVTSRVSGNPALAPETARHYNLGLRWQLHPDWALGAELYRIHIEDLVLAFSSQQILDECAQTGRRCELITRDSQSGAIELLSVQRDNAGERRVDGIDLELDGRWGGWSLRSQASYLSRFDDYLYIGGEPQRSRLAGSQRLRAAYPRWRALNALEWQRGHWQAGWRWRYLHSMREDSAQPTIPALHYHDLHLAWRSAGGWRTSLGVSNVFDRAPPRSLVNANINFDIATYDPRGRFVHLALDRGW